METQHGFRNVTCGHCGHFFPVPILCSNRWCPECSYQRAKRVRHRLDWFVSQFQPKPGYGIRMLTLTIKSDSDLNRQIDQLLKSFRRLRQRRLWKYAVRGGCTVIEVTHGPAGWHAHIHALVEARWIPWTKLRDQWIDVSGASGVYIQTIPVKAIVGYVTKYLTKTELPKVLQLPASDVLRKRRLMQPFGTWQSMSKAPKSSVAACGECGQSCYLVTDFDPSFQHGQLKFDHYHCRDPVKPSPEIEHIDKIYATMSGLADDFSDYPF